MGGGVHRRADGIRPYSLLFGAAVFCGGSKPPPYTYAHTLHTPHRAPSHSLPHTPNTRISLSNTPHTRISSPPPHTQKRPHPFWMEALILCFFILLSRFWPLYQYMPPMSGLAATGAGGSGMSVTRLSVVRTTEAMEAAFSRALRETLVGSTMPSMIMSQNFSLAAS